MATPAIPADPRDLEIISRLRRDLRQGARSEREARFLVDSYYTLQRHRIEAGHQLKQLEKADEPNDVLVWLKDQHLLLEREVQKVLAAFAGTTMPGQWALSILGIGPVLTAGLLAHIDIEKAPTVGHIWAFAGLDPTRKWEKGTKRPWNAGLKVLMWKCGESFVKVNSRPCLRGTELELEEVVLDSGSRGDGDDIDEAEFNKPVALPKCQPGCSNYGHLYLHRKAREIERNNRREFADQAADKLATTKIGKSTDAYKAYADGRLPAGRIHARARRYAVKLFLAHLHHVMYEDHFGKLPPKPYVIEHLSHVHYIGPPNWPLA